MRCTLHTLQLKKAVDGGQQLHGIFESMSLLDIAIHKLLTRCTTSIVDKQSPKFELREQAVAESLRTQICIKMHSARIKLHRFIAFQDAAIFSKRYCDIESTRQMNLSRDLFERHSNSSRADQHLQPVPRHPHADKATEHHFDNITSAKICLQSALAISRAFEAMPHPTGNLFLQEQNSSFVPPRTMPSFACCAMQASYVLLMICLKNRGLEIWDSRAPNLECLFSGIDRILDALGDYSRVFEAVQGMSGKLLRSMSYLN